MERRNADNDVVADAVDALKRGEPLLVPTDTVFGLAVAPRYAEDPDALFDLKGRPRGKAVAWLVAGIEDLDGYGHDVPAYARRLARRFWPGPLTLIVPASGQVPSSFRSASGTIGLRMPADDLALEVIEAVDSPLATTSANFSGEPAPRTFGQIAPALLERVPAALDDAREKSGVASTIVDCTGSTPRIVREGEISLQQIDEALQALDASDEVSCTSFRLKSNDGASLLYGRRWLPAASPRGIVLIAHGMAEHAGRYDGFARYLASHGLAVYAHDHIAHGRSAPSRAMLGCLPGAGAADILVEDVHAVRTLAQSEHADGLPLIAFGHSMGSFIMRSYLDCHGRGLAAAIICGTAQQPRWLTGTARILSNALASVRGRDYRSALVDGMAVGAYGKAIPDARTPYDWLSTDPAVVDAYIADPECGYMFSVGGYAALMTLLDRIADPARVAHVPAGLSVLFVAGDEDPVGDKGAGVRKAAGQMSALSGAHVEVRLYEGMRHEILNERGRDCVWRDLRCWIEEKGTGPWDVIS